MLYTAVGFIVVHIILLCEKGKHGVGKLLIRMFYVLWKKILLGDTGTYKIFKTVR